MLEITECSCFAVYLFYHCCPFSNALNLEFGSAQVCGYMKIDERSFQTNERGSQINERRFKMNEREKSVVVVVGVSLIQARVCVCAAGVASSSSSCCSGALSLVVVVVAHSSLGSPLSRFVFFTSSSPLLVCAVLREVCSYFFANLLLFPFSCCFRGGD